MRLRCHLVRLTLLKGVGAVTHSKNLTIYLAKGKKVTLRLSR